MSSPKSFDLVVIGAGPGGYVAAIRGAQHGKKVAIIEKESLGGTCLNWGCIPTKALLHTAEQYQEMQHDDGIFNLKDTSYNWGNIIKRSRGVAEKMSQGVQFLMKKNKIETIYGTANFKSPNQLNVVSKDGEQVVQASKIVIATGAKPASLPGVEIDGKSVISSREAMVWDKRPESIAIIGAGAIGLEFAYFFNAFGSAVTVIEYQPKLLPAGDDEVCQALERAFTKQGVASMTGCAVKSVEKNGKGVTVSYEKKGKVEQLEAEVALMAIGVRPNVDGLNLEKVGVKIDRGGIVVNEFCQTSAPGIYAIGDVIGQPALAHSASAEALVAADHLSGKKPEPINYDNIPACIYCQPQVAQVGITEAQAKEKKLDYKTAKFPFMANGKSVAVGSVDGFVKIIAEKKYGEILGAHIIGHNATELIHELALAKTKELTVEDIHTTIHSHPTESEAILEAAGVWHDEAIHI
jgi:dihydrolipoamide dehydrogenase